MIDYEWMISRYFACCQVFYSHIDTFIRSAVGASAKRSAYQYFAPSPIYRPSVAVMMSAVKSYSALTAQFHSLCTLRKK